MAPEGSGAVGLGTSRVAVGVGCLHHRGVVLMSFGVRLVSSGTSVLVLVSGRAGRAYTIAERR